MGIEGTKASWLGLGMPPLVSASRAAGVSDIADPTDAPTPAKVEAEVKAETDEKVEKSSTGTAPESPKSAASMVHGSPVRSGQSVIFPDGDLTILGSVASGSEVVAGGSIHIYGALRGRAIAGSTGNAQARIFCNKLEAELIAIDGLYRTADEMDPQYRGRPVQAWLDGETMSMAALS
jgi:septum site-determining protein MinC